MKNLFIVLIYCTLSSCLFENPADDFKWKGHTKFEKGDYTGAIEDYNQAIKLNPTDADSYNSRGVAKSNLGEYIGAIQDFEKAMQLNPNDKEAYNNKALVRSRQISSYKRTIENLNKTIELNPK